jgi:hypothetical protein
MAMCPIRLSQGSLHVMALGTPSPAMRHERHEAMTCVHKSV